VWLPALCCVMPIPIAFVRLQTGVPLLEKEKTGVKMPEPEFGSEAFAFDFMLQGWHALYAPNFRKLASDKAYSPFNGHVDRKQGCPSLGHSLQARQMRQQSSLLTPEIRKYPYDLGTMDVQSNRAWCKSGMLPLREAQGAGAHTVGPTRKEMDRRWIGARQRPARTCSGHI